MKKKILFVCKDMNVGGVEKALLSLVNEMNPCDYEVDLILLEERGGFISLIPEWINVIILDEYLEIKDLVNDPPIKAIRKHFLKGELFFCLLVLLLLQVKITEWKFRTIL